MQRDQGGGNPQPPKASQGFGNKEGSQVIQFQMSEEAQTSRDSPRSLSAVLDTDIAMSEWISDPTDANFEVLLLLMMGTQCTAFSHITRVIMGNSVNLVHGWKVVLKSSRLCGRLACENVNQGCPTFGKTYIYDVIYMKSHVGMLNSTKALKTK